MIMDSIVYILNGPKYSYSLIEPQVLIGTYCTYETVLVVLGIHQRTRPGKVPAHIELISKLDGKLQSIGK